MQLLSKKNSKQHLIAILFFRSSYLQMFCKIALLIDFTIFAGKHLCWSLFFNKVTSLRPATLLKRDCNTGLPVNIMKFLRSAFL